MLRHAVTNNTPLAHAVADTTIARATITPGDWPRALTTARHLFHTDLSRLPTSQFAGYIAHVADHLHLDLETATAAAADAVSTSAPIPSPSPPGQATAAGGGSGRA
ncbi:MAG: hypothetical protein ACRYG2_20845 [Janthinobacterium lividum]